MQRVICFPGIGNTPEIFKKLDLQSVDPIFISWPVPLEFETLNEYALSVVQNIKISEEDILMGFSKGGLVAQSIAQKFKVKAVLLISSLANGEAPLPYFHRFRPIIKRYKDSPDQLYKTLFFLLPKSPPFLGGKNKAVLNQMKSFSGLYYYRSMKMILDHKPEKINTPIFQIHGKFDFVFPIPNQHPTKVVPWGSHLLIWEKGEIVSDWIKETLAQIISE